jgi:hypothetical protein
MEPPSRLVLLALFSVGCSCPRGSRVDDTTPGRYDDCVGQLGPAAEVEQLVLDQGWHIECAGDQLTVIASAEELEQLWPEDTGRATGAVDFTTHQLVCFSRRNGCEGSVEIADIGWSATQPGTLLVQLRTWQPCESWSCDSPGPLETQLWITPIAPVAECRFGNSCG